MDRSSGITRYTYENCHQLENGYHLQLEDDPGKHWNRRFLGNIRDLTWIARTMKKICQQMN